MTDEQKKKLMSKFDSKMKKDYGATVVSGKDAEKVEFYPTGIASIDNALGGGWAKGRLCSIYGEFSSGKTTFLTQCIANVMKKDPGAYCMFVDAEATFDPDYAEKLGVDLERLRLVQADTAENVTTIIRDACMGDNEGLFSLIVLDSTNMLVPGKDFEKEVNRTGGTMAGVAGLLSQFCKQMAGPLRKSKTTLICIEQTRENPGAVAMPGMPVPVKVGNGKAVGFAATQRIELRKGQSIKEGEEWAGQRIKFKVVKNKAAVPNAKGETTITAGKGFDAEADEALFLLDSGIFERINNLKWTYTTIDGDVIEIKGQKNIIPTLKEKGLFKEAVKQAKDKVFKRAALDKKGSENYDYKDACGEEGVSDFKEGGDDEEPDV